MKRPHKYQLSLHDTSRLQTVWQLKLTPLRALLLSLGVIAIAVCIALAVIMFTPLKTLLPGYMKEGQRTDALTTSMMVDSLQSKFETNQAYLDNLLNILDTDRKVGDSVKMAHPEAFADTLRVAGPRERAFVREMEQREKYNLAITAPMAAEGLTFTMPSRGAVISSASKKSKIATIITPAGQGIDAISDGTVIDKHYDLKSRTYTIVIQHGKGFVSLYSHLGTPVVDRGDQVITGQQIARQASGGVKNPTIINLQMWRNGVQLIPDTYLRSYNYTDADEN